MALAVRGFGQPWVHTDVVCDKCEVLPIEGYRYACESCSSEHNLCEKCYRRDQPHAGHRFLQIARDSKQYHPPLQIYYTICGDCLKAPIEGRCHRNRWSPNYTLCDDCHSRLPHSANLATEWEVIDEPKISTICWTHSPVYHFHRQCGSCGVSPITGPRFDSIANPKDSLCLICFDKKLCKGSVKNEDYLRIERPEPNKVRQLSMHSCRNCGEVPIDGPAYVDERLQDRVLCLLCFMNIAATAQPEYRRVDPPAQLGDPVVLASTGPGVEEVSAQEGAAKNEQLRKDLEEAQKKCADEVTKNEELRKDLEQAQKKCADEVAKNEQVGKKLDEAQKMCENEVAKNEQLRKQGEEAQKTYASERAISAGEKDYLQRLSQSYNELYAKYMASR